MKQSMVLVALLLTAACAERVVKTWVGHPEAELYKVNGIPTRTMPVSTGGKVVAYDIFDSRGLKFCDRSFTIADNGMITSARTDCLF